MEHIAIDLGGVESHVCIRRADTEIVRQRRVRNEQLEGVLKHAKHSRVILETSSEAFAVADIAKACGHEVRVVPSTLSKMLGVGARGIKTDRRDAEVLSKVSCAVDLEGVHIPSHGSRELKAMSGSRAALVRSRTSLINNVRGWLRTQLIRIKSGATKTFPERVRARLLDDPAGSPEFIESLLTSVEQLSEHIAKVTRMLEQAAGADEICRRLMTIPGVGPLTSVSYRATLDEYERFASAHAAESYLGLTPGENSSGQRRQRTSITKAGSKRTRYLLVQAAWAMWRSQPHDPAVLWAQQVAHRRGNKVAIVALARKLAGIMFALWRDGATYNPLQAAARPTMT